MPPARKSSAIGTGRPRRKILPPEVEFVEAYANKKNEKSQGILARLGLERIGENKNGNSYHFRGRYEELKKAVL